MNPTPAISVIVAVYNAEEFLPRCIESVLTQRFRNFELLLINDGSRDSSGQICCNFAARDGRIRVVHQENQGVAKTRQKGIGLARGEYSIHVDADDYIEPDMLGDLYTAACRENADIVICNFFSTEKYRPYLPTATTSHSNTSLKDLLSVRLSASLCNKLIRHRLYQKYQIQSFPDTLVGEDLLALAQLLRHDLRITYLPQAYYHYTPNPASLTRRPDHSRYESIRIIATEHLPKLLPEETYRPYIRAYHIVHLADACRNTDLSAQDLKRLIPLHRSEILCNRYAPLSDRLTLCISLMQLPLAFRRILLKTGTSLHRLYKRLFLRTEQ